MSHWDRTLNCHCHSIVDCQPPHQCGLVKFSLGVYQLFLQFMQFVDSDSKVTKNMKIHLKSSWNVSTSCTDLAVSLAARAWQWPLPALSWIHLHSIPWWHPITGAAPLLKTAKSLLARNGHLSLSAWEKKPRLLHRIYGHHVCSDVKRHSVHNLFPFGPFLVVWGAVWEWSC